MLQSSCLLHVGVRHVHGFWLPGRFGGRPADSVARFESIDGRNGAPSLGEALSRVLSGILPRRRLLAPFVCAGLADTHFYAAILTFSKLPKAERDRVLVISQRFCRDHRLDPSEFAVCGSRLGPAKGGGEAVLSIAVPHALLSQIKAPLAANGLYPDVIAPEFMLRFAQAATNELKSPGIALMLRADGGTILVWDKHRSIVHVGAFANLEDAEAARRTASRIGRYSKVVGSDGTDVAVYADGSIPDALLSAGLKLSPWPGSNRRWTQ
jgi:hypothetical protein